MPAITEKKREQVRLLHEQGLGRNAIAEKTGLSAGSVTAVARKLGLTFDRAMTEDATRARKADAAALRAELELTLAEDARRLRAQVWQPHEYIDHGGRDFFEARWTQPEPSPVDKLKLMQAAGIALSSSLKIAESSPDAGVPAARSMLGALADSLRAAYDALEPADGT